MWVYDLPDFGHELRCLWPVVKSYTRWCLLFILEMLSQDEVVDSDHLSQRQAFRVLTLEYGCSIK